MKVQILLIFSIITLFLSCSISDDEQINENSQNCKFSNISYGFYSGTRVYNAVYFNENLTELTSIK